jgi:hypothetical protein
MNNKSHNQFCKKHAYRAYDITLRYNPNAKSRDEEWIYCLTRPLPKKARSTAQWLAYVSIDMWQKGHDLKAIGKYIDSIPKQIKANKRKKRKD